MRSFGAVLLLLAACGGQGAGDLVPAQAAAADTVTVAGPVETFGNPPMSYPAIRTGGGLVRVDGPMAEELGRLTGAEVRAWGTRQSSSPHDRLLVAGYDVIAVNGRPVHVGVIESSGDGLVLRGRVVWRLRSAPDQFAGMVGAKVYVAGNVASGVLTVESWGVIRPRM